MPNVALPLIERRTIEAQIVGPMVRAFAAKFGEGPTRTVVAEVVRGLACTAGNASAERVGGRGLPELAHAIEAWRENGALELTVIRQDDEAFAFNVTRCAYAEMYRTLGLADWGAELSCGRDAAMIEGFNPEIELTRTQTLLGGATHCDFRYRQRQTLTAPPGQDGQGLCEAPVR